MSAYRLLVLKTLVSVPLPSLSPDVFPPQPEKTRSFVRFDHVNTGTPLIKFNQDRFLILIQNNIPSDEAGNWRAVVLRKTKLQQAVEAWNELTFKGPAAVRMHITLLPIPRRYAF